MAITKISIENFKGIGDRVEVDLKPITILFGANSAGKSTLLQAMLYLRELLERRNADADRLLSSGASIDLGGFRQFVHCHDLDREVKIGVTIEVSDDGLPVLPVPEMIRSDDLEQRDFADNGITEVKEACVEIAVGWNDTDDQPEIRSYSVFLDGTLFSALEADSSEQCYLVRCQADHSSLVNQFYSGSDSEDYPLECVALQNYIEQATLLDADSSANGNYRVPVDSKSVVPDWDSLILPKKYFGFVNWGEGSGENEPQEYEEYAQSQFILSQLILGAGKVILEELQKIRYVGPIRSLPKRNFAALRSPAGAPWADGVAAWDLLYQSAASADSNGLVKSTSGYLSEEDRLNIGYSLPPSHVYEIERDGFALSALRLLAEGAEDVDVEIRVRQIIKDIQESPEVVCIQLKDLEKQTLVSPNDIGVGVSQVVPVVVAALHPGASVVAIEQPELHLHPAVQTRMGDLFLETALAEGEGNTFILESHSEHLMLRLLRRIRECHEGDEDYPDHLPRISPDDLSVYYIQSEGPQTQMIKLRVSEDGDFLDRWPNGFFDERTDELF